MSTTEDTPAAPAAPAAHEFIVAGDPWTWRPGATRAIDPDGNLLPIAEPFRTAAGVEAFVAGYVAGLRTGTEIGRLDGADELRRAFLRLLGGADAETTSRRLAALEDLHP